MVKAENVCPSCEVKRRLSEVAMNTCLASEMLQSKLAATCVFDDAVFSFD